MLSSDLEYLYYKSNVVPKYLWEKNLTGGKQKRQFKINFE